MNTISFVTANFVARQLDYNMTRGWGQGSNATNEFFRPLETFGERFDALLSEVRAMGFEAIDLWEAHLNAIWATPEHIALANTSLERHKLQVTSLAGWFGSTPAEFEATCRLAVDVGTKILGGSTSMLQKDRAFVIDCLQRYDLCLGLENHPEKSPAELLEKIGDEAGGRIGAALDTGWFGTQNCDAAQAVRSLQGRLLHIHLKDVLAVGAHDTCRYGLGIVEIEGCVRALADQGYRGAIAVEHEPEHFDPTDDCKVSLALLRGWLENAPGTLQ
jgi:L-ribulose-5-phosphate 3-epimerase